MHDAAVSELLKHKSPNLWTIGPEATVFEAIQTMADKNIGALLVMSGGKLVGVISERDYTRKVELKGKSSRATPVQEILSSPVIYATPAHSIAECMRLMTNHRVWHLPILETGTVVGMVSIGDLVNWIITAQSVTITQLESYITGQYPG